jgi:hypothetical protein
MELSRILFPLVRLAATYGALAALEASGEEPLPFYERHAAGDWGHAPQSQQTANMLALITGDPLWSSFKTALGVEFWVITGTDRSITYLLLPEEQEDVQIVNGRRRQV